MDEERLAEIEALLDSDDLGSRRKIDTNGIARDLIAEVRRLRKAADQSYDDGIESAYANIAAILQDYPDDVGLDDDDAEALDRIKALVQGGGREEGGVTYDHPLLPGIVQRTLLKGVRADD